MPRERPRKTSHSSERSPTRQQPRGSGRCTLNFALTPDLRDWVKGQVAAGGYNSASHYICSLIRRDQEQVSMLDELRGMLHYDEVAAIPTRDEITACARRQDGEAWEAVFKHILKLKKAAAGRSSQCAPSNPNP